MNEQPEREPHRSSLSTDAGSSAASYRAVGLVILSGIFFVFMNAVVKAMAARFDPVMLIWARYFFHVMVVVVFFPWTVGKLLSAPQVGVQFIRSVLLLASTVLNFVALTMMPLGEVAAITFTSPILVAALAVMMLREKVGVWRWAAILLGFAGALLVVRPSGDMNVGAILALLCALAYAIYQVSTRLVREAQPFVSLLFGGLVGMVAMTLIVPFFWQQPSLADFAILVSIGVLGAVGHLFIIMALQRAEASKVSPFTYIQLVWAMVLSFLAFGDVPTLATVAGSIVIVASGLWVFRLDMMERKSG